jgi:TonB family protein
MALSDVFPYGAPEVVEGAPARMARSTMTASLAVALLVVMGGALLSRQVAIVIDPVIDEREFFPIDPHVLLPEPEAERSVPLAKFEQDPGALPEIVPDALEPPRLEVGPRMPEGPIGEKSESAIPTRSGGEGVAPPRDPLPGELIWVDEMPAQVHCAEPRYPELARAAGVEGTVRVLMLVGLHGRVERAIIAPQGSIPMLDQAALEAALTCVFTPALSNGHAVKVWVSQSYRFRLH